MTLVWVVLAVGVWVAVIAAVVALGRAAAVGDEQTRRSREGDEQ